MKNKLSISCLYYSIIGIKCGCMYIFYFLGRLLITVILLQASIIGLAVGGIILVRKVVGSNYRANQYLHHIVIGSLRFVLLCAQHIQISIKIAYIILTDCGPPPTVYLTCSKGVADITYAWDNCTTQNDCEVNLKCTDGDHTYTYEVI